MAHPKKYQFKDFVNLRLRDRLGTFIMLTTSLKETTWRTVTTMITYRCPENRARKKPAIMIKVHIVRVIKVCFFFSKSDCGVLSYLHLSISKPRMTFATRIIKTYLDFLHGTIPLRTAFLGCSLAMLANAVAQSPRPRAAPTATMVEFDVLSRFRHPCFCLCMFLSVLGDVRVSPRPGCREIGIAQARKMSECSAEERGGIGWTWRVVGRVARVS